MPRDPRNFESGVVYHLISRFVDRDWYITHDRHRECYLQLLARSLSDTDWKCLSYAVMSSHVHLATIAGREPLDSWIRRVHSPFADAMNKENDRIGSMFVRGPKAFRTPADRVASLLAYIHNNPVRAKVVRTAAASDWTSHRAYVGLAGRPRWLHVDEGLTLAGLSSPDDFDAWVTREPGDPTRDRRNMRDATEGDEPPGSLATVEQPTIDPDEVVRAAAEVVKLPVERLRSRRRGHVHALARRAAVRCADALGISGVAVAHALGISQQRASAILVDPDQSTELATLVARVMQRVRGSAVA